MGKIQENCRIAKKKIQKIANNCREKNVFFKVINRFMFICIGFIAYLVMNFSNQKKKNLTNAITSKT